jgi:hypothetical protein
MPRWIAQFAGWLVPEGTSWGAVFAQWVRRDGYWYATSLVVHAIGFVLLALIVAFVPEVFRVAFSQASGDPLSLESAEDPGPVIIPQQLEIGESPESPGKLDPLDALAMPAGVEERFYDRSPDFVEGGGGFPSLDTGQLLGGAGGPRVDWTAGVGGNGGVGSSRGEGATPGAGGAGGIGFGPRGQGYRRGRTGPGHTQAGERAVLGGLFWLAKHQAPAGNWSIQHGRHCSGKGCGGQGTAAADSGATAMALLCYLGAGHTHKYRCTYQKQVGRGLAWLMKLQQPDGNLAGDLPQPMYSHGLATLALCEAYGMTKDPKVADAALRGLRFLERAQNKSTGGWRYVPGDPGDMSVTGWQMMALKSAQIVGLSADSMTVEGVRRWLWSVSSGRHHGLFRYQPYDPKGVTPSMTSAGLLCQQYLGMRIDDPAMTEGVAYLMENLPDKTLVRDIYYWYYGTIVMHNLQNSDWDTWNRRTRRVLIETQNRSTADCANGSWDPDKPTPDRWGHAGGRHMVTTLSVLTLEVYYRYLPIYRTGTPGPPPPLPGREDDRKLKVVGGQ